MTIRAFVKAVRDANPGLQVRYIPATGEYRITYADMPACQREANAYYTEDRDDAAATAKAMWNARYVTTVRS